jgi:hypothetical protein
MIFGTAKEIFPPRWLVDKTGIPNIAAAWSHSSSLQFGPQRHAGVGAFRTGHLRLDNHETKNA